MQESEIIEKLNDIVLRLRDFPDIFNLKVQKYNNVANYFSTKYNCTYLPADFIGFMSILDGLNTEILTIFSIDEQNSSITMRYDEYASKEAIREYLKNIKTSSNLLFFACDDDGGRFAFKTDCQDNSVYYINSKSPNMVMIYNSFLGFLIDKIELYILKKI